MKRALTWIFGTLIAVALVVVAIVRIRYGGPTRPFPDRTTAPLIGKPEIEVVATLDVPPGNVAVSPDGRVFFSFHPEARPRVKVAEWVGGRAIPFPSDEFQSSRGDDQPFFDCVLSVRIDRFNRLWTIDQAFHGLRQPRLLAFDLKSRELVHRFDFPGDVAGFGSYVQDFQVAPDGRHVYIADLGILSKRPALIVYDVEAKRARRVLDGHPSVTSKPYLINARGTKMLLLGGLYPMHPAVDSIALDAKGEWLYYGPMSHDTLFRIRTGDVDDPTRVEAYAPKVQSDGISIDLEGNIYLTDVEHGAIARIGPDRKLATLVRDPRFRWPDGTSFGPGGWLYLTDSDLQDVAMRTPGHIRAHAPFFIFRARVGKVGVPGH